MFYSYGNFKSVFCALNVSLRIAVVRASLFWTLAVLFFVLITLVLQDDYSCCRDLALSWGRFP